MAEKVEQQQIHNNNNSSSSAMNQVKMRKSPDYQHNNSNNNNGINNPGIITRERSFVRTSNQQNINKRRSLAFNVNSSGGGGGINMQGQMRGNKPAMDIYRPPNVRSESGGGGGGAIANKLNANAQEFTMMLLNNSSPPPGEQLNSSSSIVYPSAAASNAAALLSQSKSTASLQQHMQYVAATGNAPLNRRQAGLSMPPLTGNTNYGNAKGIGIGGVGHRPILVTHSHPLHMGQQQQQQLSQQIPLINSPSSGNILHQTANTNRVKFAAEPQKHHHTNKSNNNNYNNSHSLYQQQQQLNAMNQYVLATSNGLADPYNNNNNNGNNGNNNGGGSVLNYAPLQRSKSLSSADALTRGIAGLGLALGNEVTDIGQFTPDIQALIDTALNDPNNLNSRCLMELTSHFIGRAVEGRRYALPISRLCLSIIAREQQETFLEALLNTCRQWYQEREKLLFAIQGMKAPSRARFTAFMAFLTEMFCQLKRRQLQLRTQCEGAPPPLVLLTLLSKCCEDCVKPPVRSLSEIECLFYVLTCIGQDMESQLPQQLELLLSMVRDAFLNANDAAPAIRRTLLQLIELQASHWQLAGTSVLYYYPSSK